MYIINYIFIVIPAIWRAGIRPVGCCRKQQKPEIFILAIPICYAPIFTDSCLRRNDGVFY